MENEKLINDIKAASETAVKEIIEAGSLKKGDILVIGCSSSEIMGSKIGKGSTYFAAEAVLDAIYPILSENGIYLAAQCCEHLNRALVIEKECADRYFLERVSVIPQPKAGGSFATATYKRMNCPVMVEHIKANAGIDIGCTLIGMHLRDVVVPVRISVSKIGEAPIICAYTRPKFIGGERAVYKID